MELTKTFVDHGWKVRYDLFGPSSSTSTSSLSLPTIVFIHGTPWSSQVFAPLAKAILSTKQYQILLYDLAGYGLSQELEVSPSNVTDIHGFEGDTSVKTQANLLAALLQHLSLDGQVGRPAPAVIAHDIAGTIALRAHLLHGCDFSSVLLMDTNTVLPWGDGFYKLVRSQPQTFLQLPPAIFTAMVEAVTRSACHDPRRLDAGWMDTLTRPWTTEPSPTDDKGMSNGQKNFVQQIAQANDADVQEMLDGDLYSAVRCDVTVLWGEQDQWIPREKMEKLTALLEKRLRDFVVVPEAGHLVMIDQPERVMFEVCKWLDKV